MEYIKKYQSPIGNITMASDGESLIGLWFEDDKYYADILKEPVEQDLPVFDQTIAWLNLYFDGNKSMISEASKQHLLRCRVHHSRE